MGWQQKAKKAGLVVTKEQSADGPEEGIVATEDELKELIDRINTISETLNSLQLPPDHTTAQALTEILVVLCLRLGISKNTALRAMRESWRQATGREQQLAQVRVKHKVCPTEALNETPVEPQEEAPTSEEAKENV